MALVGGYPDLAYMGAEGDKYTLLSMGGYTALAEFEKFVPHKGGRWFVHTKMLGLPGTKYKFWEPKEHRRPICAPQVYVGMYTWVLVDPACEYGEAFERVEVTPAFQRHNRILFNNRAAPCSSGYEHECTECPVGLENCYRGTHRGDYVSRHCAEHGQMGWFKEAEVETVCLDCRNTIRLRKKRYAIQKRRSEHDERETPGRQEKQRPMV
jgi:hypothetical protein